MSRSLLVFIIFPELTRSCACKLLEHLAEIRSRAESTLKAYRFDSHSAVLEELLRHFHAVTQKICDGRYMQAALKAARSFTFAYICSGRNTAQGDRSSEIFMDILDHQLSSAARHILIC